MALAPPVRPLLPLGVQAGIGPGGQGAARAPRVAVVARLATLATLLVACAGAPPSDDRLEREVAALVEPLVATQQFSGAVALMRDDRLVNARGFGLASHAPAVAFAPGTASDGGSLARTFTAAALWWLVHEDRLAMDRPVQSIVPEYTTEALLRIAGRDTPAPTFEPGTRFEHTNLGYDAA